jgi:uncharacterized protein YgiM (DUF1202 family)
MADIDIGGDKNFNFVIMKKNYWLILGMLVATRAVAQNDTNSLPPIPAPIIAPAAPAPAAEPAKKAAPVKHKKPAPKKVALNEPTVTLAPGAAEVTAENLNVRGQAGLKGETIAHLKKGEVVSVLSQMNLDKHEIGEPAQWAKIALPSNTPVWVRNTFIDATSKTVLPKKLNLRAGPGENFSVLGVIEQGTPVKEVASKDGWTQIEPPATACGFVAAMYLKQEAPAATATAAAPAPEPMPMPMAMPAPAPTPVPETAPLVTEPPAPAPVAAAPVELDTNTTVTVDTNPPPPRIVSHEGVVRHVGSIITPTAYVLYDPATDHEIDYLHTTSTELDISRYNGMRIIVTGEEAMAKRWKDTPVLTIQRIVVLDTNALGTTSQRLDYRIPRQIH